MNSTNSSAVISLKAQAKALRKYLAEQGVELGHSKCLEAIAKTRGYKNWDTASAVTPVVSPNAELEGGEPEEARHRGPVERAYRRGVSQTLARLLHHWEQNSPEAIVEEVRALLKTSQALRYEDREIHLYLNVLLPESKGKGLNFVQASDIKEDIRPNAQVRGLLFAAMNILEADDCEVAYEDKERALWRLFDAAIRLAEDRGDAEVTSGLGKTRGWKMVKSAVLPYRAHTVGEVQKAIREFVEVHGHAPTRADMPSADQWLRRRGSSLVKEAAQKGE